MKVTIVGVGRVGAALGIVLVARHLVDELVLVGRTTGVAEAEALDLLHATAFGRPTKVRAGDIAATAGSDVVIICIGVRKLEPDRAAGGVDNYNAMKSFLPALAAASPNAVLLIATNPLDALTTLAGPLSGLPPDRVIGTGTLLDTMRLRVMLSERLGISASDIRAYVLGEHGDSQFAAFSSASAGGGRLNIDRDELREIESTARQIGYTIASGKGYTNHGIALAAAEIIEAIARDSHAVMPLSVDVRGFAGVHDVCLSLPVVIGRQGVLRRIDIELSHDERAALVRSGNVVIKQIRQITSLSPT